MSEKKEMPEVQETPDTLEAPESAETPESTETTESPEAPEAPEATEAPETEAVEAAEQEEHHPAKQSSGSTGAFLAVVIALSAAGGGYYLWQKQLAIHEETQALGKSIEHLRAGVEQRQSSQQQQIDILTKHKHPDTDKQLARVEALALELRGRLNKERRDWIVSEVEYLLRTAGHRLNLEQDRATALAALREARDRLAMQAQASYQPVIRQIDSDITKLSAISLPDVEQIAAELASLAASVESWPSVTAKRAVTEEPPAGEEAPVEQTGDASGWQRGLEKIWRDLKSLVSIRRDEIAPQPLLAPEERYFLQQNLQLKLEAARLALLTRNSSTYSDSLREASSWIQRYFNTSEPAVREAQARIDQLAAIDIEPPLPALGNSIEMLRQVMRQTPSSAARAPAERAKQSAKPARSKPTAPAAKPKPAPAKPAAPVSEKKPAPAKPATGQESKPQQTPAQPATDVPAQPQGDGS